MIGRSTGLLALVGFLIGCFISPLQSPVADTANLRPTELAFAFFEPEIQAASGFVVGGANNTERLRRLTSLNGHSIETLEVLMRPGSRTDRYEGSKAGFLGKHERLLDVLVQDNTFVVEECGLSHRELARPLLLIGYYAKKHAIRAPVRMRHGTVELMVQIKRFKGYQFSPFLDGTKANNDVTITRVSDGEKLEYSLLVPHMIERYGFYEGTGTPYRVDPKSIIDFLRLNKDD